MHRRRTLPLLAASLILAPIGAVARPASASASASASVSAERPLLRFPTASADLVAFVADGDLWTVPRGGGVATRQTRDPGQVLAPHFSPDGARIAFTWRRAGGNDVWVIPATGGTPTRLTHGPHLAPYDNLVTGWTPDGGRVLFTSRRLSPLGRYDVYSVPAGGGLAQPLGLGHAGLASMSPDGSRIAYDWSYRNLGGDRWKHYRGGQAGELFVWDAQRRSVTRLTDWPGIDTAPMWVGAKLFFLSDRGPDRRLNLWVMDPATRAARPVTRYADYDVDLPSAAPGGVAFAQAGRLHLVDPVTERVSDVTVRLPGLAAERPRPIDAAPFVAHEDIAGQPDYALGSDGRAYVAARGDLFALRPGAPAKNLTASPASAEDHPSVSPDGRRLAFVTDAGREQQVAVRPLDRPGRARVLTRFDRGVLYGPRWSPDGRWLAVADANKRLWLVPFDGGSARLVVADPFAEVQDAAFSPDGRRLAYSVTRPEQTRAIHIRDLDTGRDVAVSAANESDRDPVFAADGKELFFVSARRERPFVSDRDREGSIATIASDGVYRARLSPDADPELFRGSTTAVPAAGVGGFAHLFVRGRTLFYQATPLASIGGDLPGQRAELRAVDLDTGADRVVAADARSYVPAGDAGTALVAGPGGFRVVSLDPAHPEERRLAVGELRAVVDPRAERLEMFDQAWRYDRDLFWDPGMNGVDWPAMRRRYRPLASAARSHEDMIYVLGELQGELGTSHMFLGGGASGDPRPPATTALLGVDFALDAASGRYRLARIYRGDDSRERFRAPLGDPTLGVEEGDFLLAIDGAELRAPDDPYRLLADHGGPVRLTVARNAGDAGRTVTVRPVDDETEIRKLDWIARNRAEVDRRSGGRVGYLYLSDFNELGSEDFLRQFYPQAGKAALVIDDRDNRGGFTSQWVLDLLRRPQAGIFRNREGGVTTLPGAVAPRRLVTLTSIFSSSDGDQFPYFFRAWRVGPVIGQRTWGGVRGIKGPWRLVDGTYVTVPKDSLLDDDGAQIIENRGAEPDIALDDRPGDEVPGGDRQLERAVAAAMTAGK